MGYYENYCQLCAVTFNIARLRTKHEPASAGWGYSDGLYYAGDEWEAHCLQNGCENIEIEEQRTLHLPGPGCCFDGGYNGHRISAEEMEGMRYARYIIKKPKDAETVYKDESQEEYERESEFFITTQTTEVPVEYETGPLERIRFGVEDFMPQNYILGIPELPSAVPVHDACWKIFEKVCEKRLGRVDVQGFMALWFREACSQCGFQGLRQDPVIREIKKEWWMHEVGTEYLAANPFKIPALSVQNYLHMQSRVHKFVFDSCTHPCKDNPTDLFQKLSGELRNAIMIHLSSQDIASLRLVSRAFKQIPKWLFKELIKKELPWFWELDEFDAKNTEAFQELNKDLGKPNNLQPDTNWMHVYSFLTMSRKGILGLRNRARIWEVTEEVVRRIERLRKERGCELESGEMLDVMPSEEEKEKKLVTDGFYCLHCKPL